MALPSILANITVPLVGIVDTAIVGHISNASGIGGIAIGTMLFDLLYWNFGFLRAGTGGMTAQAFGRKDRDACHRILMQSMSVALTAAVVIWAIQWIFYTVVMHFVPCSTEVSSIAHDYFFVRIWAAPATLSIMTMKGWFIGMQNTRASMVVDLTVNCVNMLASWLLAFYTPLGVVGVAWGTVIAQCTGLLVALSILLIKYGLRTSMREVREVLRWKQMRQLFTLNGNLFIRSLCFMVVYVGFTSLCSKYGNDELAIGSIMMKLFMLFSYFVDGFAYAGEALTGRFFGANDGLSLRKAVGLLFIWTLGVGTIFTLLYAVGGDWCIRIMTSDESIIAASRPYQIWLVLMPLISCAAFMWDGVYIGATAGKAVRNCMIWAAVGFVVVYLAMQGAWGIQAVYFAYFTHLIARTAYLTLKWKATKMQVEGSSH